MTDPGVSPTPDFLLEEVPSEDVEYGAETVAKAKYFRKEAIDEYNLVAFMLAHPEKLKDLAQREDLHSRSNNCAGAARRAYEYPAGKPKKHFKEDEKISLADGKWTLREMRKRCREINLKLERAKIGGCALGYTQMRFRNDRPKEFFYINQGARVEPGAPLRWVGVECSEMPSGDQIAPELASHVDAFRKGFCPAGIIKANRAWAQAGAESFAAFECYVKVVVPK